VKRELIFTKRAMADLERLQRKTPMRVFEAIECLAETGDGDIKRMKGKDQARGAGAVECRLRVGKWRVRVLKDDKSITVEHVLARANASRR
jgi:mRNA-degrading endonuclease RelE of RelBE toxin-antitoxin system